jgi:nicotinamidase-related amidase
MRLDLIVVDGQNDFLATGLEPWNLAKRRGALYVEKSDVEANLVADFVRRMGTKLFKIHATKDNHHRNDGSHNVAWKGPDGRCPDPFTLVSHDDVKVQKWVPRLPFGIWEGKQISSYQWALNYTDALEKRGRNQLCLWPVHCQIATWGACTYQPLLDSYDYWCDETGRWIDYWVKGTWQWTEHYSALVADVPDPTIPQTQMNANFIKNMMDTDVAIWTGWAGSHCTRWTALDAVNYFGQGHNEFLAKSVFFTDCCAPVTHPIQAINDMFAKWRDDFLAEVQNRGAKVTTSTEYLKTAC